MFTNRITRNNTLVAVLTYLSACFLLVTSYHVPDFLTFVFGALGGMFVMDATGTKTTDDEPVLQSFGVKIAILTVTLLSALNCQIANAIEPGKNTPAWIVGNMWLQVILLNLCSFGIFAACTKFIYDIHRISWVCDELIIRSHETGQVKEITSEEYGQMAESNSWDIEDLLQKIGKS